LTLPTIDVRLAEATLALHQLQIGTKIVRISYDGVITEFQAADTAKLEAYIAKLEAEKAGRRRRGAVGFVFA
jgi:hypothetical protein